MAEYIDRKALIKWLTMPTGFLANCDDCIETDCLDCIIAEAIKNAPAVDVDLVRHGMWEEIRNPYGTLEGWIHRDCGRETKIKDTYCPNCGAKMDGERKDP